MPIFKVRIERDYTITEDFTRYVEAPDYIMAKNIAYRVAEDANHDCPDDVSETAGGWAQAFCPMDIVRVNIAPLGEEVITDAT